MIASRLLNSSFSMDRAHWNQQQHNYQHRYLHHSHHQQQQQSNSVINGNQGSQHQGFGGHGIGGEGGGTPQDYSYFNPDGDCSHIENALERCLGHYQKQFEFEGCVMNKRKGPIFGGYGSFLQVEPCFPSRREQNLGLVQNIEGSIEKAPRPVNTTLPGKNVSSTGKHSSHQETMTQDFAIKSLSASLKDDGIPPEKRGTVRTDGSVVKQKTLKLRIKWGANTVIDAKKHASNTGLGLKSSSTSPQDSPDKVATASAEVPSCSDLVPLSIIRDMKAFEVPGGRLISPLPDNVFYLLPEKVKLSTKDSIEMIEKVKVKKGCLPNISGRSSEFPPKELHREKPKKGAPSPPKELQREKSEKGAPSDENIKVSKFPSKELHREKQEKRAPAPSDENMKVSKFPSKELHREKQEKRAPAPSDENIKVSKFPSKELHREKQEKRAPSDEDTNNLRARGSMTQEGQLVALKQKKNEVKINKFKESGKETFDENFSLVNKGHNEPAKTNNKRLHISGVKRKTEQADIKRETNKFHCNVSSKQARQGKFDREPSRQIEREKNMDIAENNESKSLKHGPTNNAHISNVVDAQSLPEQTAQRPAMVPTGPTLVFDNWVLCDGCAKWRVLPYGVASESLPPKWFCRMLDWLPGLNSCHIPEKDTTEALYKLYGISQSQVQSEANDGKVQLPASVGSSPLPNSKRVNQNPELKTLQSSAKIVNTKKGLVQTSIHKGLGKVKQSSSLVEKDELCPVKNINGKYYPETARDSLRLSQNEDEAKQNATTKQKRLSDQKLKLKQISGGQACDPEAGSAQTSKVKRKRDDQLKECKPSKKVKPAENLVHDAKAVDLLSLNTERPMHGLKNSNYSELTKENNQNYVPLSGGKTNVPQDVTTPSFKYELSDFSLADKSTLKDQHQLTKERKLNEWKESNSIKQGPVDIDCIVDCEGRKEEKKIELKREKGFKTEKSEPHANKSKGQKKKKVTTLSSNLECRLHEMESHCMQQSKEHVEMHKVSGLTKTLKRDSSGWPPFVSTTSSSSKLCYTKTAGSSDVRCSPVESSVSSLPVRNSNVGKQSLVRSKPGRKDELVDVFGDEQSDHCESIMRTKDLCKAPETNVCRVDNSTSNMLRAMNNSNVRDAKSSSVINVCNEKRRQGVGSLTCQEIQERGMEQTKHDKVVDISNDEGTEPKKYGDVIDRKYKARSSSVKDGMQNLWCSPEQEGKGSLFDASSGEFSRIPGDSDTHDKGTLCLQPKPLVLNGFVGRDIEIALTSMIKEHWQSTAKAVLQEGRDFACKADQLKNNGGDELVFVGLYFRASLKFLQSASILETSNTGRASNRDSKPMALYKYSARMSEECARTYEQNRKWAAATLAYQCVGVAHMHVIMAKTASLSKERQELQSAAQLIRSGESPRSSASDIDDLNYYALTQKDSCVNPDKGVGSLHASGNYVIDVQHCQHYHHLLQYVEDTNAAVDAFAKAKNSFAAVNDSSYEEEEMSAVKKAFDCHFQNVDGLLNLMQLAMEAINL